MGRLDAHFSPLYRVLYEDLAAPCFQFLRNEFETYLRANWWGLISKRNRLMERRTIDEHPRLTIRQAAKAAGVEVSTIRHLTQMELLPRASVQCQHRTLQTVDVSDLDAIAGVARHALSLTATAQRLLVPERRLRELIAGDVVKPLVSRDALHRAAAWRIPQAEIARLCIAPAHAVVGDEVSLHDVFKYWRLRRQEAPALVTAILERELRVHGTGSEPLPLGALLLARAATQRWLSERRSRYGDGMSVNQAGRALGIKQQVAYALARRGLLRTFEDAAGSRRVADRDLEEFEATFVSLVRLASTAHRVPRALLQEIAAQPVCGPHVDGVRQYFYRRADVAEQAPAIAASGCWGANSAAK
jgi:DNA-binding transcriptional MerR regulator